MSTVEYLPYATGDGAVVMSQADYVVAAPDGVVPGLADPTEANKAWRQSSVMAAAIANWISTTSGVDVLDDGNVSALTGLFENALTSWFQLSFQTGAVAAPHSGYFYANNSGQTIDVTLPVAPVAGFRVGLWQNDAGQNVQFTTPAGFVGFCNGNLIAASTTFTLPARLNEFLIFTAVSLGSPDYVITGSPGAMAALGAYPSAPGIVKNLTTNTVLTGAFAGFLLTNSGNAISDTLSLNFPQTGVLLFSLNNSHALSIIVPSTISVFGFGLGFNNQTIVLPAENNGHLELKYVGGGDFAITSMSPGVANSLGISLNQSIQGAFKNLKITTGSNTARTITADQILVSNSGSSLLLTGVNVSYATGTTGVNGYDGNGALGTSQWLYDYVIFNPSTSTAAALCSHSATAPSLPSGYTYFARVGADYLDGSGNLMRVIQYGRKAQYVVTAATNTANLPVAASGSAGNPATPTWVGVSLSSFVPTSVASRVQLMMQTGSGTGVVTSAPNNSYGGDGSSSNPPFYINNNVNGEFDYALESSSIYWASTIASGSLNILGWEDNL